MSYRKFSKKKRNVGDFDAFKQIKVYVPIGTANILKELSEKNKLPMSRMIAIAVDNELDCAPPFNYECKMPDEYREYMYAAESGKLMEFLAKFPVGIGVDTIMLCRRDIGISDRSVIMAALKELIEKDIAELYEPNLTDRSKAYRKVRLKDAAVSAGRHKRYKAVEGKTTKNKRRVRDDEIER